MWTNAAAIIPLAGSAAGASLQPWGQFGALPHWVAGLVIAPAFALALLGGAGARGGISPRTLAGLLALVALLIPSLLFAGVLPAGETSPFGIPLGFTVVGILSAALVISGLLLQAVTRRVPANPASGAPAREKAASRSDLIIGAALFAALLFALFWLMMWDSTYDPIGVMWLGALVVVAVITGLLLAVAPAGGPRMAGLLYALIVPTCLIIVAMSAQNTGFRPLTEARAERISLALEAYHVRQGRYPESLGQLSPRDMLFVPPPVILFGQAWCYDATGDFYQLGYVDRNHWSDPRLIGRLYKSTGPMAQEPALCATEIGDLIGRYPDYFVEMDR